jgi:hypothetical protein
VKVNKVKDKERSQAMSKRMNRGLSLAAVLIAATVFLAWSATDLAAGTGSAANAAMKGHPEKQNQPTVVPKTAKPMPAPKAEKVPKTTEVDVIWVPGDYYWTGDDWLWADGYWLDQPWPDAVWVPGHWTQRWWGWTWVPGYWF